MTARAGRALSCAALALAVSVGLLTVFLPGVLHGPAVMNGSARGTALVVAVAGAPVVALGMALARAGSRAGWLLWLGGLAFVVYNAVLLCFATPFNALFLCYVGLLGTALWALGTVTVTVPADAAWRARDAWPEASYLLAVVGLNTLAWLARILPELTDPTPAFLAGTGLTTNPVFVQDLAVWLPLMAVAGLMLGRGHPRGLLVAGAGLVYWQLEALAVAVDQAWAHHVAPGSSVASAAAAWMFAGVFVVGLVPTWSVFRRVAVSRPRRRSSLRVSTRA